MSWRKRILIQSVVAFFALPAGPIALAQQPQEKLDDEVVVTGRRLDVLRKQLIESEDAFFDRYNALIGNKEYEVHCRKEQPIGSRIPRRYCRTGFEDSALAQAGAEAGQMLQYLYNELRLQMESPRQGSPSRPGGTTSVMPGEIQAKRPTFQRYVRETVAKDPQLLQLLIRHAQLMEKYRSVHDDRFGSGNRDK